MATAVISPTIINVVSQAEAFSARARGRQTPFEVTFPVVEAEIVEESPGRGVRGAFVGSQSPSRLLSLAALPNLAGFPITYGPDANPRCEATMPCGALVHTVV